VTSRLDAAEGVHTRGERQAGAVLEVEHVVGSRGKALGSGAATQGHVLAATCHGRKLARSAAAHEGSGYAPDGGVAATVKDIGVDVENACAVAKIDKRTRDGRAVRELDLASEPEFPVGGAGTQISL
jgi:hypothetical protein